MLLFREMADVLNEAAAPERGEAAPEVDAAQADDAEQLTLRAQVEQASGPVIAAALPSAYYAKWLMFKKAPPPQLISTGKGVYLAPHSPGATQAQNYAFYFDPIYAQEGAVGHFKLRCRAGGCETECSYAVRHYEADKIVITFPFANAFKHLGVCTGRPILLPDDHEKLQPGVKKRRGEILAGIASGGAPCCPRLCCRPEGQACCN